MSLVVVGPLLINGIVLGLLYAAITVGFSLILGVQQVINFCHGVLFAFGAYFFWLLSGTIGFWPAFIITPILVGLMGLAIERGLVARVYGEDPLFGLLITFGLSMSLEEAIRMGFGTTARSIAIPAWVSGIFRWGDIIYPKYRLFLGLCAFLLVVGTWLLLEKTEFGAIVKAGMFDSEMVSALGRNLSLLRTSTFVLGTVLAGMAGVIAGPIWGIKSSMGIKVLMPAFLIALIGGLGSIKGTLLAGLLVGLSLSLGTLVIPRFVSIIPYIIMGVVIYFMPRGFFGTQTILE